jgi:hypothetical protein
MTITTVALTDTFDVWRTRTNQLVTQSNYYETNLPTYAYANNIGVTANAFASATIAGANTAVGAGANNYLLAVIAGANTAVGTGANNFTKDTLAGANTAVGDGANNFTKATLNGANTAARDATNLTSGTVPSARITGVGTITTGVWNGTDIAVADGGTGASDASTARTNLGLAIGTNVQAYSARLAEIAALAPTADNFIVGNGTSWTLENASAARTSLGLGTIATQGSGAVTITGGSISGITDLAVADGGTGASDASTARTNLGLGTIATQGSGAVSISGGSISGLSSLGVSGDITATGDITAFSSDARLKGDIQTITDALSKVQLITGITYKHNDLAKSFGYTDESRLAGVLAQEVEAVLPEVVVPAPFDVADDGTSKSGENYKTVKYEKIVPLLIEAIKELTAKVEMLESRVNE